MSGHTMARFAEPVKRRFPATLPSLSYAKRTVSHTAAIRDADQGVLVVSPRLVKFSARLRELIDADPIRNNRKVLAREIGVTPAAISLYIHGKTEPTLHNLVALADFLKVDQDS